MILTEDTRVSGKLLSHFSIKTPMKSYHTHNEHKIVSTLVKELSLRDNKKYALLRMPVHLLFPTRVTC